MSQAIDGQYKNVLLYKEDYEFLKNNMPPRKMTLFIRETIHQKCLEMKRNITAKQENADA